MAYATAVPVSTLEFAEGFQHYGAATNLAVSATVNLPVAQIMHGPTGESLGDGDLIPAQDATGFDVPNVRAEGWVTTNGGSIRGWSYDITVTVTAPGEPTLLWSGTIYPTRDVEVITPGMGVIEGIPGPAEQDSGWRSIVVANGSTARDGTGTIQIRRVGDRVRCRFGGVGITDASGAGVALISSEISGFGCDIVGQFVFVGNTSGTTKQNWLRFNSSLWWTMSRDHLGATTTRTGVSLAGEAVWYTNEAWPTTLPGTAV